MWLAEKRASERKGRSSLTRSLPFDPQHPPPKDSPSYTLSPPSYVFLSAVLVRLDPVQETALLRVARGSSSPRSLPDLRPVSSLALRSASLPSPGFTLSPPRLSSKAERDRIDRDRTTTTSSARYQPLIRRGEREFAQALTETLYPIISPTRRGSSVPPVNPPSFLPPLHRRSRWRPKVSSSGPSLTLTRRMARACPSAPATSSTSTISLRRAGGTASSTDREGAFFLALALGLVDTFAD